MQNNNNNTGLIESQDARVVDRLPDLDLAPDPASVCLLQLRLVDRLHRHLNPDQRQSYFSCAFYLIPFRGIYVVRGADLSQNVGGGTKSTQKIVYKRIVMANF